YAVHFLARVTHNGAAFRRFVAKVVTAFVRDDLPTRGIFFFSSRRRHTRWPRDWSSDVCSPISRYGIPAAGMGGPAQDPVRKHQLLFRNRTRHREATGDPRRGARVRDESGGGGDPVSSRRE